MVSGRIRDAAKAEYWRGHLERWGESGMKASDYCRREGLSTSSLWYWSSKFANQSSQAQGMVKLTVGVSKPEHPPFEVVVSDRYRVLLPAGFDANELARLLSVLEIRG